MLTVDIEDIIESKSWMSLTDVHYETGNEMPDSGLVYCNIEHIPDFFSKCYVEGYDKKYVVVSGYSDFGPCLQKEYPVWKDISKWVEMQTTEELGYRGINVNTRCNPDKCNLEDKYSIKCWSFTDSTFPEIPPNVVHWFCVNSLLFDDKVTTIPLGIAENETKLLQETKPQNIQKLLYVNFENYNIDRLKFKEWFYKRYGVANEDWLTLYMTCCRSQTEYLQDILSHQFIFCPYGNGVDTYRYLETLYLGRIPICISSSHQFSSVPTVYCRDFTDITKNSLESMINTFNENKDLWTYDKIKFSYWKNEINKKVEAL